MSLNYIYLMVPARVLFPCIVLILGAGGDLGDESNAEVKKKW